MSTHNQQNQNVNTQYNAAGDIIINQKNGQKTKLIVSKRDFKWGITGSIGNIEFDLETSHKITYKRDEGLFNQTIMLYVDGALLYKEKVRVLFNPLRKIEYSFVLDGVDCDFIVQFVATLIDAKIRVGGIDIFQV